MAASKLTQLLGQGALKALANLGGTKPLAWALVFVLIAVVNTVIDQISDAVRSRVAGVDVLAPAALLGLVVWALYWFAHKVKLEPRAEEEEARPVKVLILFLSQPGKLEDYADIEGTLGSPELGDRLGRLQWRMPIAAVAHHIGRLERLVVIGSPGEKGTNRLVGDFKKLLDRLLPPGKRLSIESSGIFLGRDDTGVDFENPQQLIEELGAIYRRLEDQRIREHDILIDVTGGTKVNTAAAVALTSLLPDRRFQYVSTNTYKVKSFDVTLDLEAALAAR